MRDKLGGAAGVRPLAQSLRVDCRRGGQGSDPTMSHMLSCRGLSARPVTWDNYTRRGQPPGTRASVLSSAWGAGAEPHCGSCTTLHTPDGIAPMPRSRREDYPGAWHHVMNRGLDQMPIFADDFDRRRFLMELRDACREFSVGIACYCLMSNHFHALLHTPGGNLSRTMQRQSSRYTQAFNQRHRRDGPLFRGRFKSVAIADTAQLLQASLYIHRNPVEAGVVSEPALWPWSSAAVFMGAIDPPGWLHPALVLDILGGAMPTQAYRQLLDGET